MGKKYRELEWIWGLLLQETLSQMGMDVKDTQRPYDPAIRLLDITQEKST